MSTKSILILKVKKFIMNIPFVKMHGDGNDFVIIDNNKLKTDFSSEKIRKIANRNTGIGCDQLILLEESKNFDIFMRIFNQDGTQAEMCGNASRCVASLLFTSKKSNTITIETISNNIKAVLEKSGEVSTIMKVPKQDKKYFHLNREVDIDNIDFSSINEEFVNGMLVNMGNPHIVFVVSDIEKVELEKYGKQIERNHLFKKNINVEIVQIYNKNNIKLKFWERGAGLTKSCGSGIMAAFYACFKKNICASSVNIILPLGKVLTKFHKDEISIMGKAEVSFLGEFNYE